MMIRKILAVLVLLPVGCAQQGERLMSDLARMERSISDLRSLQAEQSTQMAGLQNEVRELSGKVEELEYGSTRRAATISRPGDSPGSMPPTELITPPPLVPLPELEADERLVSNLSPEVGRFFSDGLLKLRKGAYADALMSLREALDSSYKTEWYSNILFWIGVANEGIGDNAKALRAFHEMASTFPKNTRTPLALLRQGSVFIRLQDSASARLTFQKIINDFPSSSEARAAKERLKDLRG